MKLARIKSAATIGSLATALLLAPAAPAQAVANCANGTQTDVGYTILSGGYIKGSASYTSCSNRPISKAKIWIREGGYKIFNTEVDINGVTTPSSRSFSPKDNLCLRSSGTTTFDTIVSFYYSSGGQTDLRSNVITVTC